ncbi:MAG: MurT ligase domain-containing protein [Acidimicrobiales bacterium]|nr:MurT ligase domain-containing protein [Acidimicrobiales bacterium]
MAATATRRERRRLRAWSRLALAAGRTVAGASRLAHLGTGSVIGGKLALSLDHGLLRELAAGRDLAIVSGTNGKTTTTHLLAAALSTLGPVATNSLGANMPPGLVAALGNDRDAPRAALEVDERWVPRVLEQTGPATVVLLNLSRDQLDRSHEVRKIAQTWHEALAHLPVERVVANADDPLVAWAATAVTRNPRATSRASKLNGNTTTDPDHQTRTDRARHRTVPISLDAIETDPRVIWVSGGGNWTLDATGCPECAGRIAFATGGWHCLSCSFQRPEPEWCLQADSPSASTTSPAYAAHHIPTSEYWPLTLSLPGRVNASNATMVLAAATAMGAEPAAACRAMGAITSVAGRYKVATIDGLSVRMLLAKNPAGWQEAIELVAPPPTPCIAAINARIADGRDPSWLWDVPFERLRGRLVVATGERRHDLAVRLAYADVEHVIADSLTDAVHAAASTFDRREGFIPRVDLIANYTAFQDYLDEVGRDD